jgi:hypothetical protein
MVDGDPGETLTSNVDIDGGNVEMVRAEIRIGVGELRLEGGGTKLLTGSFRYSENLGKPDVRYDATGFRGRLTVESPKSRSFRGDVENTWTLQMGSKAPVELHVNLGVGESHVDLSKVPLQSLEVHVGVGELDLNLDGKYSKNVNVSVRGGVGEAKIRLPKDFGVVADAKGGIGSVDVKGMTKRGNRYYNDAYKEGEPALILDVRGLSPIEKWAR